MAVSPSLEISERLQQLVQAEWQRSVPDAVKQVAADISARYQGQVQAVLFYGSCLRTGIVKDKILDFYVLVDDYSQAYQKKWLAWANKLIPPNVFYHEMMVDGVVVRSKYAVISVEDFKERVQPDCLNVSIWARFCQPCVPLLLKSDPIAELIQQSTVQACVTMLGHAVPMCYQGSGDPQGGVISAEDHWSTAFNLTYASEVRSEPEGKGREIYAVDSDRYDAFYPELLPLIKAQKDLFLLGKNVPVSKSEMIDIDDVDHLQKISRKLWARRARNGKLLSILRLIKASMTFDGGIDYLAWKIGRHSGVQIEVTDKMRRFPIISGLYVYFKMRGKAFK